MFGNTPSRTSGRLRATLVLLFCALPFLAAGRLSHADIQLPDIGDPASQALTLAQEEALGREILKEIRRNLPLLKDTELNSYVRSLGLRLVSSSPDAQSNFYFVLIDDPAINAFATPGGVVAINSGLILAATNEAEVAAVVAHEIAHVTQRHLARMYAGSDKVDIATGLGILAAILVSAYSSELAEAALYSSIAAGQQQRLNFSRANEQEADRIGITTLANAGFDPHAMPSFFERMQRLSFGSPDATLEYLSTHPVTTSRISDSAARADQYSGQYTKSSIEFTLTQARIRALTTEPKDLLSTYQATPVPARTLAIRYVQAIALRRAGRYAESIALAKALAAERDDILAFKLAVAEAQIGAGAASDSMALLRTLDGVYPRYAPVTVLLAQALIQTGDPSEARRKIEGLIATQSDDPELHKLRAEAAAREGLIALSHESMADYYLAHGQVAAAVEQLELALKDTRIDETTEARIRSKRGMLTQRR